MKRPALPDIDGFGLWLMPDATHAESLQKIIYRLSSKFNSPEFEPHLTIGSLNGKKWEKYIPDLNDIASNEKPFFLQLSDAVCKDHPYQKLCFPVIPNSSLHFFWDRIESSHLSCDLKTEFPHISLHYSQRDCEDFPGNLFKMIQVPPMKILMRYLAIIRFDGRPESWQVVYKSELSKLK